MAGNGEYREVAITGLGMLSSLGIGKQAHREALRRGDTGVRLLEPQEVYESFATRIGAQLHHSFHDLKRGTFSRGERSKMHDSVIAGELGVREALEDTPHLVNDKGEFDPNRKVAVVAASVAAGMISSIDELKLMYQEGISRRDIAFATLRILNGRAATVPSMYHRSHGSVWGVYAECATSAVLFEQADMILNSNNALKGHIPPNHPLARKADVVVGIATEVAMHEFVIRAFGALGDGALSRRNDDPQRASRPFDANADGFLAGEATAVFVMEPLELAQERGAHIYGIYRGGVMTSDGNIDKPTEPDQRWVRTAMEEALIINGVPLEQVGWYNAHATSTQVGDKAEIAALIELAERANIDPRNIAVSSLKGMFGHALGATGIETAAGLLAMEKGYAIANQVIEKPITDKLNLLQPRIVDGELDYFVPMHGRFMMKGSFGFGGINGVGIFEAARNNIHWI